MDILIKDSLFTSIANARETLISLRNVIKDDLTSKIFDILYDNEFYGDGYYSNDGEELLFMRIEYVEKRLKELFQSYKPFFQMTYTNVKNYDEDLLKLTFSIDTKKNAYGLYDVNIYFAIYREDDCYDRTCSNYTYEFEQSYSPRTED
jgi:hypothetical protein